MTKLDLTKIEQFHSGVKCGFYCVMLGAECRNSVVLSCVGVFSCVCFHVGVNSDFPSGGAMASQQTFLLIDARFINDIPTRAHSYSNEAATNLCYMSNKSFGFWKRDICIGLLYEY